MPFVFTTGKNNKNVLQGLFEITSGNADKLKKEADFL